ncbi:MAG: NPXTG-anchored protein [Eubacteriales bacterium]
MKKITVLLVLAMLISLMSFSASAAGELEIPMAQTAPVIDGVFDAEEWANAWHFLLDGANPPHITTANSIVDEYYPTWDFYTMWDADNFYLAVVCKGDITLTPKKMESGMDTRDGTIRGDGFQLFMNPSGDYAQTEGKDADIASYGGSYIWTDFYCEYADGVTPFTWSYAPFDGDVDDAMPDFYKGYIIDGTRNGDTYTIEIMAPWTVLNGTADGGSDQWKMTIPRKAGDKVIYDFNTLDYDGTGSQCRYGMTENGARQDSSLDQWKQFTLVSEVAGKAPVVETEAPIVDEAPADGTPVVTESPATGDAISILFAAAALAAVIAIASKSKKK